MKARTAALVVILVFSGCSKLRSATAVSTNPAAAAQQALAAKVPGNEKIDVARAVDAGSDLAKAIALSDTEVKEMALKFAEYADGKNRVAGSNNRYSQRLLRLVKAHQSEDGLNLSYKVYLSPDINAFSLADGSVRVHSGLMDLMKDDELLSVLGHEIGHVKLKHVERRFRMAYAASGLRKSVAASKSIAGTIAASEIGGLFESFISAQYSQSQEEEADSYGLRFLLKHSYNGQGSVNALYKLAKLEDKGGPSDEFRLLATHPASRARAQRLAEELSDLKKHPEKIQQPVVSKDPPLNAGGKPAKPASKKPAKTTASAPKPATEKVPEKDPANVTNSGRSSVVDNAAGSGSGKASRTGTAQAVVAGWYVQLSAETEASEAKRKLDSLKARGVTVRAQEAMVNGKTFYRILAGPYTRGSEAEAAAEQLKMNGLADEDAFTRRLP